MCIQLETPRLILRQWQNADLEAFYQLNSNTEVMQYFPKVLDKTESDQLAYRIQSLIQQNGWGFWAVELKSTQEFMGFTGLHHQPTQFKFSPCTEIGWRLNSQYWGNGYATEAALRCLEFAFNSLNLNEIVAFTAKQNLKSQAVMKRIGMTYKFDFDHPELDDQSPLKEHQLFSIQKGSLSIFNF